MKRPARPQRLREYVFCANQVVGMYELGKAPIEHFLRSIAGHARDGWIDVAEDASSIEDNDDVRRIPHSGACKPVVSLRTGIGRTASWSLRPQCPFARLRIGFRGCSTALSFTRHA
jgi:hypothetical protein